MRSTHASAHGLVLRALLLCGGFRLPAPAGTELQRGRSKLGGQRRLLTRAPFVQAVEGFTWGKYVKNYVKICQIWMENDAKLNEICSKTCESPCVHSEKCSQ